MQQRWRDCKLGDVITLQRGFDLPERERRPGTVPIVSSSGITGYHDEARCAAPGVVTGRYGTLGEVFLVEQDYWPLNTALFVKDFKGNVPGFVAHLLRTLSFGRQNAAGAVPGVNRNHLHALDVKVPDVLLQRLIADILSSYDDLIENNTKRVKILEEIARSLYREWFVHFRFPGHEGVKLVTSTIGEVPEGWKATTLDTLTAYVNRGLAPKYADDGPELVINQKCIRDQRLNLDLVRRHRSAVPPDKYVRRGDVLINSTGVGTLGRVAQVLEDVPRYTVDTHVSIVRPSSDTDPIYFGLMLFAKEPYFAAQGIGSTNQTELSRGRIGATEVLAPPYTLQRRFGEVVRPIRQAAITLIRKNNNLRSTRDLLLPRLVSGEIDVSRLEAPRG